ncbi:hypothetical protein EV426DRAFT_606524 [Tirmania nivea]|nr:hypothetical protein EV426DRAFT_606524 [Tirmania nivea]
MPPRRPAASPAPGDPGSRKIRVHTTVPAVKEGSARMSRQSAVGYEQKLAPALMSHEQLYLKECESTYFNAKLRELGITLLSNLFGVKHPNTIDSGIVDEGLVPQQHFKMWLGKLTEKGQRIFTFLPTLPEQPRQPLQPVEIINGVENLRPGSGQFQHGFQSNPPQIFGPATSITIGQLVDVLKSLSGATHAANMEVHKLTVRDVVNILTRHNVERSLGKEPYEKVKALVVAILGRQLSQPNPNDLPKSFKNLVKVFREKVKTSIFLTRIENEWKKEYEHALRVARTKGLIEDGLVVSKTDYDHLDSKHGKLETKHGKLETEHGKLKTEHGKLGVKHAELATEYKKFQESQEAKWSALDETLKFLQTK